MWGARWPPRNAGECRARRLPTFFLLAGHQINIELGDADARESVQLFAMFLGVAEYAEAVDHFVRYEFRVAAAYFAVMQ